MYKSHNMTSPPHQSLLLPLSLSFSLFNTTSRSLRCFTMGNNTLRHGAKQQLQILLQFQLQLQI